MPYRESVSPGRPSHGRERAADPRFDRPLPGTDAAMTTPPADRIHPTAVINPQAELADDVQVGPFAVLDGPVRLGPGCVVRPHAHLIGPLTMGRGNTVYT